MASFADMLQNYSPPTPPPAEPPVREGWDVIAGRWPVLNLPKPPEPLSLDWVWAWLLLEPIPNCPELPGSLVARYVYYERWHRIEECYEHGGELPADRLNWLRAHEKEIRPLVEQEKAAYFVAYPPR